MEGNRGKIVTISLEGFVFFGSAVKLLEEVKRHVVINTQSDENHSSEQEADDAPSLGPGGKATEMSPLLTPNRNKDKNKNTSSTSYASPTGTSPHSPSRSSEHSGSFSHLQPVYGLTSDQIMAHHNKWKQLGSIATEQPTNRSHKKREFTDIGFLNEEKEERTSGLGPFAGQALGAALCLVFEAVIY